MGIIIPIERIRKKMEEQMSVHRWAWIKEKCDGDYCPGNCDNCFKWNECPPNVPEGYCLKAEGDCELCWEKYGKEKK